MVVRLVDGRRLPSASCASYLTWTRARQVRRRQRQRACAFSSFLSSGEQHLGLVKR